MTDENSVFYRPGTVVYRPARGDDGWLDFPGKVAYRALAGHETTAYLSELHDDKIYVGTNKHTDEPVAVYWDPDLKWDGGWREIRMEDRR